jgi:hypothetical protein
MRVRPDQQEIADNVKLAAIAAVSAVLTATLVIGAGRAILPQTEIAYAGSPPAGVTQVIDR